MMDDPREIIRERKEAVMQAFSPMNESQREEFENTEQTFEFIQQCCEGHNRRMQDLLRHQSMHHFHR